MRKALLAISILVATGTATAEYTLKYPIEQAQGGSLPNGSIRIGEQAPVLPAENWTSADPIYSDWVNSGSIYGCTNFSPSPNTITIGQAFTQTQTGCKQDQTRNRQNREQETTTLAYRNIGSPTIENQAISVSSSRNSVGIRECLYSTVTPNSYWETRVGRTILYWNNATIFFDDANQQFFTQLRFGVHTYTQSAFVSGSRYTICRYAN